MPENVKKQIHDHVSIKFWKFYNIEFLVFELQFLFPFYEITNSMKIFLFI